MQETVFRLQKIDNIEPPILICNEKHRFIVAEQMREIDIKPKSIILEPIGKNTAPAVAIGAVKSRIDLTDSVLFVLLLIIILKILILSVKLLNKDTILHC